MAVFTLLHTNDFHNRLTASQAAVLRELRASSGHDVLLLDAGDAVGAGNLTFRPGGEPILDRMNDAGYDAMTVGNREFHLTSLGLRTTLARAAFPVLSANLRLNRYSPEDMQDTAESLPVRPYIVHRSLSGWTVVVFGLTVPMITDKMLSRKVSTYVFEEPLLTARRLVPALREQYAPDLLIGLTHIGILQDRLLASSVPGIDLIIGGHSHTLLERGERVGETLLVQTGSHARYVGRVAVERMGDSGLCLRASVEAL